MMRIVRPGDGSLVIRLGPGLAEWALGLIVLLPLWVLLANGEIARDQALGVFAASAIAAFFLAYVAEIAEFTFDPARNELRWDRRTLCPALTKTRVPFRGAAALADIRVVEVYSHRAPGDDYHLSGVSLTLPTLVLPLTRGTQTGTQSHRVARAIACFLNERGLYPRIAGFDADE
jgi:hypothetical protein